MNSPPGISTISNVILPPLFGVTVSVYFLSGVPEVDDMVVPELIAKLILTGAEIVSAGHKVPVVITIIAAQIQVLINFMVDVL